MIEQKIIDYLSLKSRGYISLSLKEASAIVEMVKGQRIEDAAFVRLCRKNHCNGQWEWQRNISTSLDEINKQILLALDETPNLEFYKYECYSFRDMKEGDIYSVSPNIFG